MSSVKDSEPNFEQYDIFGTTGGCQATYTVIPPSNPILPSNCTNLTSVPQIEVDARDHTGPLSRFGFIDQVRHLMQAYSFVLINRNDVQCTDISVTPLSGVPPYTLTVSGDWI